MPEGQINDPSFGICFSLLFLPATPLSPSQTFEVLFELTLRPSRALNSPRALLPELHRYKDIVVNALVVFVVPKIVLVRASLGPPVRPPCWILNIGRLSTSGRHKLAFSFSLWGKTVFLSTRGWLIGWRKCAGWNMGIFSYLKVGSEKIGLVLHKENIDKLNNNRFFFVFPA